MTTSSSSSIALRTAVEADAAALQRLAQLDSKRLPAGPHLVAERGGAIVAALSQSTGIAIADPFVATADAVDLLVAWSRERTARPAPSLARRARLALAS